MKFYYITVTKKLLFPVYFLLSILFEKTKNQWWFTTVWYKSNFLKFVFLEDILHLNIYYMSPKKAWAPTFWGGGRFASFYKNIELVGVMRFTSDLWSYSKARKQCNFFDNDVFHLNQTIESCTKLWLRRLKRARNFARSFHKSPRLSIFCSKIWNKPNRRSCSSSKWRKYSRRSTCSSNSLLKFNSKFRRFKISNTLNSSSRRSNIFKTFRLEIKYKNIFLPRFLYSS